MPDDLRIERILDAAYACFIRHGIRRTTMDDIAAAAEMSRAAVYQYVQNKDDVYRRLAKRLFDEATDKARAAAAADGPLADRLHGVLAVKVEFVLRLTAESPHAEEFLTNDARLSGDLFDAYWHAMHELLASTVADAARRGEVSLTDIEPGAFADLGLALTKGLEDDLSNPDRLRKRLRQGVELLVAGLVAQSRRPRGDQGVSHADTPQEPTIAP